MLSHVSRLGRGLPSSGNFVQECSFLHAYGQDVHDHGFLGHIPGPFTYAIEDDAFDDDKSCERLNGILKDSLHLMSNYTFGNPPPTTDDLPR